MYASPSSDKASGSEGGAAAAASTATKARNANTCEMHIDAGAEDYNSFIPELKVKIDVLDSKIAGSQENITMNFGTVRRFDEPLEPELYKPTFVMTIKLCGDQQGFDPTATNTGAVIEKIFALAMKEIAPHADLRKYVGHSFDGYHALCNPAFDHSPFNHNATRTSKASVKFNLKFFEPDDGNKGLGFGAESLFVGEANVQATLTHKGNQPVMCQLSISNKAYSTFIPRENPEITVRYPLVTMDMEKDYNMIDQFHMIQSCWGTACEDHGVNQALAGINVRTVVGTQTAHTVFVTVGQIEKATMSEVSEAFRMNVALTGVTIYDSEKEAIMALSANTEEILMTLLEAKAKGIVVKCYSVGNAVTADQIVQAAKAEGAMTSILNSDAFIYMKDRLHMAEMQNAIKAVKGLDASIRINTKAMTEDMKRKAGEMLRESCEGEEDASERAARRMSSYKSGLASNAAYQARMDQKLDAAVDQIEESYIDEGIQKRASGKPDTKRQGDQ